MLVSELDYSYPESLVATAPREPKRVMVALDGSPQECSLDQVLDFFSPGDVLVVNNTQVLPRRVFSQNKLEILFLSSSEDRCTWQVLFPARSMKVGDVLSLPEGVELTLQEKGLPQTVQLSRPLSEEYFLENGEVPLPPYIQKARGERHNRQNENDLYQTAWAKKPGSFAAPTASLHFTQEHLQTLRDKGVKVCEVTLHVGLGTFMPVKSESLDDHQMHKEWVEVSQSVWQIVQECRSQKKKVWALGTTVVRSLEAVSQGHLHLKNFAEKRSYLGETDLLIQPGYEFQVVDGLLTNFHQPKSTLLALVGAFAGMDFVHSCYQWAIEKGFLLFSYGDLSVWQRR